MSNKIRRKKLAEVGGCMPEVRRDESLGWVVVSKSGADALARLVAMLAGRNGVAFFAVVHQAMMAERSLRRASPAMKADLEDVVRFWVSEIDSLTRVDAIFDPRHSGDRGELGRLAAQAEELAKEIRRMCAEAVDASNG
ncbi:hypothetical protein [Streptomyces sp. NPDC088925]|uniref:hypothetical protein n=1 Tax=Streptomyces sp. NPDC088925 TaxID=3365914 RepID=UPI0037F21DE7